MAAVAAVAYVGLDVGQREAVGCWLLADGREPVPRWVVPNTLPGAEGLVARLVALAREHGVRELRIGLESTDLYWWHLACALTDAPALAPYRPAVYALNPKLVRAFRTHYGALPKTDRADAFVIAERVQLRADWAFSPKLAFGATAAYEERDFRGGVLESGAEFSRKDKTKTGGVEIAYSIYRGVGLRFSYRYIDRNSTLSLATYTTHQAGVGISVTY